MVLIHILSLIFSAVAFLFILSVVVLIHEAGHFFMARRFGIKIEEFGFGFPPRLWSKKRGETRYSINLIPLGGFVKLFGEDEAGGGRIQIKNQKSNLKDDIGRAFFARPPWQRALVILAGVVMNSLLAFVIFYIILFAANFKTQLPAIVDHKFYFVEQSLNNIIYVTDVAKNSPAQISGIKPYSKVVALNNAKIKNMEEFIGDVDQNKGKKITLSLEDEKGKLYNVDIVPRISPPKNEGRMGVSLGSQGGIELVYKTPLQKLFSGITYPVNLTLYSLDGMKQIISSSVRDKSVKEVGENVSGPLGIFVVIGSLISQSSSIKELLLQGLSLIGLISISLAFFNVLPIPALDGGRLFFVLIEMITRKKINPGIEAKINAGGFIVLISFLIYITVFFDFPKMAQFVKGLF
ncbi:MAG: M50 family metallopeptidase [Patescibacteria group bacterium]